MQKLHSIVFRSNDWKIAPNGDKNDKYLLFVRLVENSENAFVQEKFYYARNHNINQKDESEQKRQRNISTTAEWQENLHMKGLVEMKKNNVRLLFMKKILDIHIYVCVKNVLRNYLTKTD